MKLKLRYILLCCIVFSTITPLRGAAQQVIFSPPKAEWLETGKWLSPYFEASKDTRVEWTAYPQPTASDPTFSFVVVTEDQQKIEQRDGLSGLGFLDGPYRVQLEVTLVGIGAFEIRLFNLQSPPVTSQAPSTTSSPTTTSTPPSEKETVTIAVYTALPPNSYVVTFGLVAFGALVVIAILGGIVLILAAKYIDLMLARKVKPK